MGVVAVIQRLDMLAAGPGADDRGGCVAGPARHPGGPTRHGQAQSLGGITL